MNDILRDLSTANLIKSIEENLFYLIPAFRGWPKAEVHEGAELKWSMTGVPFPLFNSILDARLEPERIGAAIQSLIGKAQSRKVPLLWWTGPTTQPADLGVHLRRYGFVSDGPLPGMAIDLAELRADLPTPTGFTVQVVRDKETLNQWSRVCVKGFELPDFVAEAFYDLMSYVDPDTTRAYLGWINDRPVATSLLILAAGVAGMYNVATIPEARRQGMGAIMTAAPLREARSRGYKAGILIATEAGEGVYRSLGFKEYCQIDQFLWFPEDTAGEG
jgi:GNAT superfamily N-acetyltransferase